MISLRAAALASAFGFGLFAGCYSERLPPPAYRYTCDGDGDCNGAERCIRGLCQVPCTLATAREDCPTEEGFATCFNGVCSNTCDVADEACPPSQECIDLSAFGIDLGAGNGGGGPFGSSNTDAVLGLCGNLCEGDDECPGSERCLQGFCAAICDPEAEDDPCPDGFLCAPGLNACLPDPGETDPTGGMPGGVITGPDPETDDDDGGTADGGGTAEGGGTDGGGTAAGGTQ